MFLRTTSNGRRQYLQIAESYRDAGTGQVRQRHIASLGRLDRLLEDDGLKGLIDGLLKVSGRGGLDELVPGVTDDNTQFEPARTVGALWAVCQLWQQLGLGGWLQSRLNGRGYRVDIERLVRVLVTNRLCDPCAKLGVLRWLERVYWPGSERITHQPLLRAMDALLPLKEEIEQHLQRYCAAADELDVVFYDMTTVRIHGSGEQDDDLRVYGHSKDVNGVARQYAVGVVQTAAGLPVHHEGFAGNVAEAGTVRGIVERLLKRFTLRRLILVADRGMLSLDNLEVLEGLRLANGQAVEYIVAVAARCSGEFVQPVVDRHGELLAQSRRAGGEVFAVLPITGDRRLIVAHDPTRLRQARRQRARRLNPVIKQARALERKLNAQEAGAAGRGRRLSDHGACVQLAQAISEVGASRLMQLDLDSSLFNWWWDVAAFKRALALDGKLIVVTNVPEWDAAEVIARDKALADIERGFRVLKSQLDIAPVHHRRADRIRAHTLICFLALVIQRLLRQRLRNTALELSPATVLARLEAIQYHPVRLVTGQGISNLGHIAPPLRQLFIAIDVEIPTRARIESTL
jgi:hypothetical protein